MKPIVPIFIFFRKDPFKRLVPVLLFIIAGALAYWISSFWTGQEDAYITYSYAKRISSGEGYIFSKGDNPVLGTTTPLYTLVLAALALLGCPPHVSSPIIGIFSHGFVAVVIFFIVLNIFNHRLLAITASIFWSFSLAIFFRTGGMETPLYLLLLSIFTLVEVRQPMFLLSAILLGLMLLPRPETLLLIAIWIYFWIVEKNYVLKAIQNILVISAVCAPWLIYSYFTFGSVIPNSISAKIATCHDQDIVSIDHFVYYFVSSKGFLYFLILGIALGISKISRQSKGMIPLLIWFPLFYACLKFGSAPDFAWYYAPPMFLIPILVASAIEVLVDFWADKKVFYIGSVILFVITAGYWFRVNIECTESLRRSSTSMTIHKEMALEINKHCLDGDVIAAMEVGNLAYWTNCKVIDLIGLTSPECVEKLKDVGIHAMIRQYDPRFIVTVGQDFWGTGYQVVKTFPYWIGEYTIWIRN